MSSREQVRKQMLHVVKVKSEDCGCEFDEARSMEGVDNRSGGIEGGLGLKKA